LDVFFAVLSVSGMTLAAVIAEREQAEREREQLIREQAAMEARLRLATIVESSDDAIIGTDMDGIITTWNKGAGQLYGYSAGEVIGKPFSLLVPPDRAGDCAEIMEALRRGNPITHYETVWQAKDGARIEVSLTMSPLRDSEGRIVGASVIGHDVTERKLAERELSLAHERLHLAMQAGRAGGWEWDIQSGRSLRFGETHALLGTIPETYSGTVQEFWDRVHPEDGVRLHDAVEHAKQNNTEFNEEFRVVWPNGTVHWLRSQGRFFYTANGEAERMLGISVNITERKQAEEALRKSEERFRLAAQAGKMFAYEWDAATDVIVRSGESAQILGTDEMQVTGQEILTHVHPDDRERLKAAIAALSPEKPYLLISYRIVRADSTVIWVERNSRAHFDEQGRLLRIIGMVADVTERKQAEQALRKSEERFRLAAQAGKMYSYEWDVATDMVMRSEEHVNVLRFSEDAEQLTRQQLVTRVHPDDRALFVASVDQLTPRYSTTQINYRVLRPDGSVVWLEKSAKAFFDEQGRMFRVIGMVADITDRKQAEEALRESEDKLRLLLDSTAEAIYGIDLEGRCTFCNPASIRALGYERVDELLGKNMHDLIHHTRADGSLFPVEECRIFRAMRTAEGVHVDDEVLWRGNGTSFPAEYWSYPQRKGQEVVGAVVAFIDITQRKLAEAALANVSRRLIEAQEQERTRIARELHDDFAQRLALLAVKLEQLHQDPPELPEIRTRIGDLQKQTTEIAIGIQTLSHELHSAKLQYLGIAAAMRGFCEEFEGQTKVKIDFKSHDLPSPLSPDISLCLFRVLQEAVHNSAKHRGVRHVEVQLWGTSGVIHLTVSDSGAGFDSEAAKQNRGLGLISMEERLKLLEGTFSIESQPGRGTQIHAQVPLRAVSESMRAAG
jgi:PAS domain S-box-containing protein